MMQTPMSMQKKPLFSQKKRINPYAKKILHFKKNSSSLKSAATKASHQSLNTLLLKKDCLLDATLD